MNVTIGTFELTQDIRDKVADVLETGRLSYGPYSRALEKELSWLVGKQYGVLSNSGTSSLVAALLALKEKHGWKNYARIVVPSLTFVATYNAVLHAGMKPVVIDIDPETWDFGARGLWESHAYPEAIIVANLFGKPARLSEIREFCNDREIVMIEDSCEAIGALHEGRMVGGYGDVSVFSFYMAHIITSGVGGMAVTDDADVANLMRSYVNHGLSIRNLPDQFDSSFLGRDFEFNRIGHSYRVTEMESAIALSNLHRLLKIISARQNVAAMYMDKMSDMIGKHFDVAVIGDDETSSWQMFPIVLRGETKYGLMSFLRESGIECRDMVPLTCQPCYAEMIDKEEYPNAQYINEHGLYFGCHENITEEQVDYVSNKIRGYFQEQ